eukprot:4941822-Alexandrium_andersonii.AAC.1
MRTCARERARARARARARRHAGTHAHTRTHTHTRVLQACTAYIQQLRGNSGRAIVVAIDAVPSCILWGSIAVKERLGDGAS